MFLLREKVVTLLAAAVIGLSLSASPAAASGPVVETRWLMGTVLEIEVAGPTDEEVLDAAFDEVARIEKILSTYRKDSEIVSLMNDAGRPVRVSATLFEALAAAKDAASRSDGSFDPTYRSAPKVRGWEKIELDPTEHTVTLRPGCRLDLGGIGKGFALDRAAEILKTEGVAAARLNFGGQILAFGSPQGSQGWAIALRNGERDFRLRDRSIAVSGTLERGKHIISPETGEPIARSEEIRVIARTATSADAWSTALFVSGSTQPPPGICLLIGERTVGAQDDCDVL